jgi:hypothetical protein
VLEFLLLFLSTWAFGSVGGTAYAVANGFSNMETILLIAGTNTLLVVIWFAIIGLIVRRLEGFLDEYRKKGIEIPFLVPREKARGMTTVGLGIVAALTIGSMGAVTRAYAPNANRWMAWAAITPGAVAAGLLWTMGALGIIPFLPSPWLLYLVAAGVTAVSVGRRLRHNVGKLRTAIDQIRGRRPPGTVPPPG